MLKQVTQFKAVIQGIESIFHFDSNCPIAVAKEALLQCLKWLGQVEDQAKSQAEAQVEEEKNKQEEAKPPEPEGEVNNDQ